MARRDPQISCSDQVAILMHAHGLKLEDLQRVADGPTSTLGAAHFRRFGPAHALRTTGGLSATLHFHTMGMLDGDRCYIRWHVEPNGVRVVALALLRGSRWDVACDPAHDSEHDWTGGLWLAATHYIGDYPATLEEVRAASIALLDRGSFVQQPNAASALQVRPSVPRRKRGKGRKPAAVQVTLRLAPDVLARWRATGPGWHSRMVARIAQPDAATKTQAPRRTRSAKGQGGVLVSLRIPPLALARWRAIGAGWQSRIAALLAQPD